MIFVQVEETLRQSAEEHLADTHYLHEAALAALEVAEGSTGVELTVLVTRDSQIQTLNREYRGVDAPTDVLAFEDGSLDPDSGRTYLGDVAVSYPRAVEQASQAGHSVRAELQLLVVHGVLHLLGYDHAVEGQKKEMWALMDAALSKLGTQVKLPE